VPEVRRGRRSLRGKDRGLLHGQGPRRGRRHRRFTLLNKGCYATTGDQDAFGVAHHQIDHFHVAARLWQVSRCAPTPTSSSTPAPGPDGRRGLRGGGEAPGPVGEAPDEGQGCAVDPSGAEHLLALQARRFCDRWPTRWGWSRVGSPHRVSMPPHDRKHGPAGPVF